MNTVTLVGIAASAGTAISLLPQLIKVLKEKKADDVSLVMMIILFAGLSLWVYYGVLKKDMIIIIANGFSLIINALLFIFSVKYKKRDG